MRDRIVSEIRRIAEENGSPPGIKLFENLTGIKVREWRGKYWARWGDALAESGFEPNRLNEKLDGCFLLEAIAQTALETGKVPTEDEFRMHNRDNEDRPSYSAVKSHFGKRSTMIVALRSWVLQPENCGYSSILELLPSPSCAPIAPRESHSYGHVYLLKAGEHYKIGQSSDLEKRVKSINVALPDKATLEHAISTDDPPGIEAYWHRRFADRRTNGEWFKLSKTDILAFKKRKFQ